MSPGHLSPRCGQGAPSDGAVTGKPIQRSHRQSQCTLRYRYIYTFTGTCIQAIKCIYKIHW